MVLFQCISRELVEPLGHECALPGHRAPPPALFYYSFLDDVHLVPFMPTRRRWPQRSTRNQRLEKPGAEAAKQAAALISTVRGRLCSQRLILGTPAGKMNISSQAVLWVAQFLECLFWHQGEGALTPRPVPRAVPKAHPHSILLSPARWTRAPRLRAPRPEASDGETRRADQSPTAR